MKNIFHKKFLYYKKRFLEKEVRGSACKKYFL